MCCIEFTISVSDTSFITHMVGSNMFQIGDGSELKIGSMLHIPLNNVYSTRQLFHLFDLKEELGDVN